MEFFNRKNIGWILTGGIAAFLMLSIFGKLSGNADTQAMLASNGMGDWITILGIGELLSVILFVIPKTMRLGTLLLSAYFGGAILFHMTHPDPLKQAFIGPAGIMVFIWIISWVRGNEIIS